ncbi:helix-turn-helix transcriptional regulator [Escherichia albertii]|uniref:helix-turn-helix domain-containing protein n=1 Tax=Escherichia albertii TaxID=208962 RepID=UPI000CF72319|nr:helix-turn-helix transcriptional regulator [Escherichia albertii]EFB5188735.1 helix-turn-helix transcriptional regulator [Escherichia albertii]EJI9010432.1 helix-turn-helix transcriptional regulator [Escherichia albertii]EJQ6145857.1 helix-turn-helix transcriptional regulator [Escherichia albertii]MCZ9127439.1 helix-turn-helix transcriptional regulator [Escherichia albertii]
MSSDNIPCYVRSCIKEHGINAHVWISLPLTDVECDVLELLIKGYTVTQISKIRGRSAKTISAQKYQIYKKLDIRNDITFWLDLPLSPYVKIIFSNRSSL